MKTHPTKDARSQTGSNLRPRQLTTLLEERAQIRDHRVRVYQRAARAFHRQSKKLFSKADLRLAAKIIDEVKRDCERDSFAAGRDVAKRNAVKAGAGKKLHRLLGKALPAFAEFEKWKRRYLLEHGVLVEAVLNDPATEGLTVHYGDSADGPSHTQEFVAPFALFNVHADDPEGLIRHNFSSVQRSNGYVLNDFSFDHDESSDFSPWGLSFSRVKTAGSFVSCGINYIVPTAGRVHVAALLDQMSSGATVSITDKWGFSYGNVEVRLQLFISILWSGGAVDLRRTLLSSPLQSGGDDVTSTLPTLASSAPYLVNGITPQSFSPGESLQILAGAAVEIDSELNDMHSKLDAILWWRLKKIAVAVF